MPKKNKKSIFEIVVAWPFRIIFFVIRVSLLTGIIIGGWYVLQTVGILTVNVPVTGASMLPTLPEEGYVGFQRYYQNEILEKVLPQSVQKGDIVVFENERTHRS